VQLVLSRAFLRELGHRIATKTGEPKSTDYLLQRISVAVQKGNSASVLGGLGYQFNFVFDFVVVFYLSLVITLSLYYFVHYMHVFYKLQL